MENSTTRPYYVYFLVKQELKYLSNNLRVWKQIRSQAAREQRSYLYDTACSEIANQKIRFRHLHIATSLSKGKSYEQIEKPVRHNPFSGFGMDTVLEYQKWISECLERAKTGLGPHLEASGNIFRRDLAPSPEDIYRRNQERVSKLQQEYA